MPEAYERWLIDLESRVKYLEAAQLYTDVLDDIRNRLDKLEEATKEQPEWNGKQWDMVTQLKGRVLHIENKQTELREAHRQPLKKKGRYLD